MKLVSKLELMYNVNYTCTNTCTFVDWARCKLVCAFTHMVVFSYIYLLIVSLYWEVQFHLLISRGTWSDMYTAQQALGPGGGITELWSGPHSQRIDTVDWCLPITMLPTLYTEELLPQQTLTL